MTVRRRHATVMKPLALCVVLAVAGCGIAPQSTAQPIEPPLGPFQAVTSPSPLPTTSGSIPESLYLVKDGRLVAQIRHVATVSTMDDVIDDLLAGPTEAESAAGMSSALVGVTVTGVQLDTGLATVDLGEPIGGRSDELLAYAQVVCTLTARNDVRWVRFTRGGKSIDVPRGDSSLSHGPLTFSDYAELIAH